MPGERQCRSHFCSHRIWDKYRHLSHHGWNSGGLCGFWSPVREVSMVWDLCCEGKWYYGWVSSAFRMHTFIKSFLRPLPTEILGKLFLFSNPQPSQTYDGINKAAYFIGWPEDLSRQREEGTTRRTVFSKCSCPEDKTGYTTHARLAEKENIRGIWQGFERLGRKIWKLRGDTQVSRGKNNWQCQMLQREKWLKKGAARLKGIEAVLSFRSPERQRGRGDRVEKKGGVDYSSNRPSLQKGTAIRTAISNK